MRRASANRIAAPSETAIRMAALICARCGHVGCTVFCLGRDDNGAVELTFCDLPCAEAAGALGYLQSERGAPHPGKQDR